MTRLNHHQRKYWGAILIVFLGLAVELFIRLAYKPSPPIDILKWTIYYSSSSQLRLLFFAVSIYTLYSVKGSIYIMILSGFNLCAIILNLVYINPLNFAAVSPFRVEYFGPAYRMAEIIITTWAVWNVRHKIYSIARNAGYSFRALGHGWRVHFSKARR